MIICFGVDCIMMTVVFLQHWIFKLGVIDIDEDLTCENSNV